ncbi:MAG: tyrosine-protein phosphatase [Planctomycetes bacterium]|nr:tyrosine-protein phosphatase [Planctomycetota bacterium]
MAGLRNVRDVGGYATTSGGWTRWGRLYRADDLSGATAEGLAALRRLGIRTAISLKTREEGSGRRDAERAAELGWNLLELPFPAAEPSGLATSWLHELLPEQPDTTSAFVAHVERTLEVARQIRIRRTARAYEALLEAHAEVFAEICDTLRRREHLPAVVYCRLGADRTGLVVAIVLGLVGVGHADIVADYRLSNEALRDETWASDLLAHQPRAGITRTMIDELMGVSPETLRSTLACLVGRYGDLASFARARLRLEAEALADLRSTLSVRP